jgi:membrane protein DedA with SNARE-associated domain
MTVLVPSLLPPPAPFKIFVLLAGFAEITTARFTVAVTIGRGARYLIEGLLALRYGDRAIRFLHENAVTASLAAVGLLVAGLVLYIIWTKAQAGKRR